MRVNGKIIAALAMPIVTAGLLGGVLRETHHTSLPPFRAPATFTPLAKPLRAQNCIKNIPVPFSGVAVDQVTPDIVQHFNGLTHSRAGIIEFYNPFPGPFDQWAAAQAVQLGDVPFVQLNPGKLDPGVLQKIASGADDQRIRNYARSVKNFKYCVIISFGHEMNGWWYRWGAPWNTPKTFISAWRNVYHIFASVGAKNVIWSWDPSHQYAASSTSKVASPASEWYPGNAYVDWIGLDGYLSVDENHTHFQNFDEIFSHQIAYIRKAAPGKPIFLAETGVAPDKRQVAQIEGIFRGIRQYRMTGLIWFELNRKEPWKLDGRPVAARAYQHGVASFPPPGDAEGAASER